MRMYAASRCWLRVCGGEKAHLSPLSSGEYEISAGCYDVSTCSGIVAVTPKPASCHAEPDAYSCMENDLCGTNDPPPIYCDCDWDCVHYGDCCVDGPC